MRITQNTLLKMYQNGEKFTVLTCYDASFAKLLEKAGIEVLLVGDSLGNVLQGKQTTLSVTLNDMKYHTRCVAQGATNALIMTDMPFGTFQESPSLAFKNATKLIAAGAHMVKIEGGRTMAETIQFLTKRGIPVCAHIGLTPQSVHQLSGYKLQGKNDAEANILLEDAIILEKAGANLILMELIPAALAKKITQTLNIPTIGIGAGADCSAQVLVLHDMLGIYPTNTRFNKNFMTDAPSIEDAIKHYVKAVKSGMFPAIEHQY